MAFGRRLGIDYGQARVGIAICDADGLIATPLTTLKNDSKLFVALEKLIDADNLPQQLTLGQREKGWNEATAAMDLVEDKFGGGSIRPASLLKKGLRKDREL